MKVHRSARKHGVLPEDAVQAADMALWIEPLEDEEWPHRGLLLGFDNQAPGPVERDAAIERVDSELVAHLRWRAERGLTVTVVAEGGSGIVSVGSYQPVASTAEILAVATLPDHRRRGLAAMVTAGLAHHASEHGVAEVLLSAQDDDVARIYARIGFQRVGTAMTAHL